MWKLSIKDIRPDLQDHQLPWKLVYRWVLCGSTESIPAITTVCSHLAISQPPTESYDDLLKHFWELQETDQPNYTKEEEAVVKHFEKGHVRTPEGRFVVPLPRKPDIGPLGESRSQAIRRFRHLEQSLHQKNKFHEVDVVIQVYLSMEHAEPVPTQDLDKSECKVYLVYKESSTTTKV